MTTYHFTAVNKEFEKQQIAILLRGHGLHYKAFKHGLIKISSQPGVLMRCVSNSDTKMNTFQTFLAH